MDPVSHALIGANIAGLAGHTVSLSDPGFIGPVLASMAPDLDIVFHFRGDVAYIKSHRGLSHSVPALMLWSAAITLLLYFLLPGTMPIAELFLLTAAGAFSHSFFDMLNSYGVRMLWPLVKEKISFSLVGLVDWLIVALSVLSLVAGMYWPAAYLMWAGFMVVYILNRKWIAENLRQFLEEYYPEDTIQKVIIMPARYQIFSWDFLVETESLYLIGKIQAFSLGIQICSRMEKPKNNQFIEAALDSSLGKLFTDLTPHLHVMYKEQNCQHVVEFTDLRYYHNHDFMHTGVMFFDDQCCATKQVFSPYNRNHRVIIG